jgi:hypothetical protein
MEKLQEEILSSRIYTNYSMPSRSDPRPWQPIADPANPAGYAIITRILQQQQDDNRPDNIELAKAAAEILKNPLELRRLSDRVYTLMMSDLQHQQERGGRYGGSFGGGNFR